MTKNREMDVLTGRFLDTQVGVLGYEGSHRLAILACLGEEYLPATIDKKTFQDMRMRTPQGVYTFPAQGMAEIRTTAPSGVAVEVYTSMSGVIKHRYPLFSHRQVIVRGESTRHRAITIVGTDIHSNHYRLTGLYEPIRTLARNQGMVTIEKNGTMLQVLYPIYDDSTQRHLERIISYFKGQGDNSCSVETAVQIVHILHHMSPPGALAALALCHHGHTTRTVRAAAHGHTAGSGRRERVVVQARR